MEIIISKIEGNIKESNNFCLDVSLVKRNSTKIDLRTPILY